MEYFHYSKLYRIVTFIFGYCLYYILEGNGKFKINGKIYPVRKDDCIEIPPNTEFVFAGKMKLLLVMQPAFRPQDATEEKENDIW